MLESCAGAAKPCVVNAKSIIAIGVFCTSETLFSKKQKNSKSFFVIEILIKKNGKNTNFVFDKKMLSYLTDDEKCTAANLFKVLTQAKQDIEAKPAKLSDANYPSSLEEHARIALVEHGFKVDYFEILNAETLTKDINDSSRSLVIAAACYLNKTRLIDNVFIEL